MTIGDHIGQYRIVEKIGAGGMGLVYLGEHMLLGRRAAIKTLLPKHAIHPELVERFFNEARATSAISDPGVIQIFDFGYHVDGSAYIVMELLEGEALSDRIERLGMLSVGEALRIARQAAGSLGAAHAHAIVHRDLKPENIYLVHDVEAQGGERTKILDFGICKVTDDSDGTLTDAGTTVGTPAYMAPEQCRGAPDIDHRADIYAFGCLMFHMLTGRLPFEANAPGDFLVAHLRDEPRPPSAYADVPPVLDALVLRCLAKSPADRFQSMAQLGAAIGDVSAQLGLSAVGTPPSTRTLDMDMPAGTPPSSRVDVELAPLRSRSRTIAGILVAGVAAAAVATYIMFAGDDATAHADVALPPPDVATPAPIAEPPTPTPAPTPAPIPTVAPAPTVAPTPTPPLVHAPPRRSTPTHRHVPSTEDLYDTR